MLVFISIWIFYPQADAPNDNYNIARDLELLKPPAHVYTMNAGELSKLEHDLGLQQEKPKEEKKKRYHTAGSKSVTERNRDEIENLKGKGVFQENRDRIDEYKGLRPRDPPMPEYNGNSGMTPPEYNKGKFFECDFDSKPEYFLQTNLEKLGYKSWETLKQDINKIDSEVILDLGHTIVKFNKSKLKSNLYNIALDIFDNYNPSNLNPEEVDHVSRDLLSIYYNSEIDDSRVKTRAIKIESKYSNATQMP